MVLMQEVSECEASGLSDRIGKFDFSVRFAEPTPESRTRWNGRIDALTDLLVTLWNEEQSQLRREQLAALTARN
jgi:hypothetical protein